MHYVMHEHSSKIRDYLFPIFPKPTSTTFVIYQSIMLVRAKSLHKVIKKNTLIHRKSCVYCEHPKLASFSQCYQEKTLMQNSMPWTFKTMLIFERIGASCIFSWERRSKNHMTSLSENIFFNNLHVESCYAVMNNTKEGALHKCPMNFNQMCFLQRNMYNLHIVIN